MAVLGIIFGGKNVNGHEIGEPDELILMAAVPFLNYLMILFWVSMLVMFIYEITDFKKIKNLLAKF